MFFRELGFFKDSMFSERDFRHLKAGFAKACPHSHLRYKKTYIPIYIDMEMNNSA